MLKILPVETIFFFFRGIEVPCFVTRTYVELAIARIEIGLKIVLKSAALIE